MRIKKEIKPAQSLVKVKALRSFCFEPFTSLKIKRPVMASLLLGTGGTALLLAFFKITKEAYYINLALGFALLAGVVGVAFAIIILGKSKDGI